MAWDESQKTEHTFQFNYLPTGDLKKLILPSFKVSFSDTVNDNIPTIRMVSTTQSL